MTYSIAKSSDDGNPKKVMSVSTSHNKTFVVLFLNKCCIFSTLQINFV